MSDPNEYLWNEGKRLMGLQNAHVDKVEISHVLVYYHVVVTTSKGDMQFRVRDDGWALFVQTADDNRPYARISVGTDSDRTPDRDSALVMLTAWAKERFED